jgi:hypothetical protein
MRKTAVLAVDGVERFVLWVAVPRRITPDFGSPGAPSIVIGVETEAPPVLAQFGSSALSTYVPEWMARVSAEPGASLLRPAWTVQRGALRESPELLSLHPELPWLHDALAT